jgi:asparagine synthase (glutamine-hydrolysing)
MNLFVCIVRPSGAPVDDEVLASYGRNRYWRHLPLTLHQLGDMVALVSTDGSSFGPSVARHGSFSAVSIARLDNRTEIQRWLDLRDDALTDLALILRSVVSRGISSLSRCLGAFAVVLWDTSTRTLIAARDSLGVKTLYYTVAPDRLAFSSRAQLLITSENYDVQYLAERLAYAPRDVARTPFAEVRAVPAATVLRFHESSTSFTPLWSPYDVVASSATRPHARAAIDDFRALLTSAVRLSLSGAPDTWAHLSGGLDSSSVVSIAQWLASTGMVPHGVAGTITWVGDSGTGDDEREFAQAVVVRYGVRNEQLLDFGPWPVEVDGPPLTDAPTGRYPFHALDLHTVGLIQRSGGRVLLTGNGGDHILLGNMFFFADWLVAGRAGEALREMARRAALGRVSFWELAYKNALLPLLPRALRNALLLPRHGPPPWLSRAVLRRYDLGSRTSACSAYDGRLGHKYADYTARIVAEVQNDVQDGLVHDRLDVRHPYLYRPLVEFALRLPPEMCVQPNQRKWILREALRGILPEVIRTRVGKAAATGIAARWLTTQRQHVSDLLRDPILAELGCIDPRRLKTHFETVSRSSASGRQWVDIYNALAIEMWLRVRSGRWTQGGYAPPTSQS